MAQRIWLLLPVLSTFSAFQTCWAQPGTPSQRDLERMVHEQVIRKTIPVQPIKFQIEKKTLYYVDGGNLSPSESSMGLIVQLQCMIESVRMGLANEREWTLWSKDLKPLRDLIQRELNALGRPIKRDEDLLQRASGYLERAAEGHARRKGLKFGGPRKTADIKVVTVKFRLIPDEPGAKVSYISTGDYIIRKKIYVKDLRRGWGAAFEPEKRGDPYSCDLAAGAYYYAIAEWKDGTASRLEEVFTLKPRIVTLVKQVK